MNVCVCERECVCVCVFVCKLCVSKLPVGKLCVIKLCLNKLCVRGRRVAGVRNQKQEPHTKTWGKNPHQDKAQLGTRHLTPSSPQLNSFCQLETTFTWAWVGIWNAVTHVEVQKMQKHGVGRDGNLVP